ncbi:MAG: hypothetical protein U5L00_07355 [Desulfovermiculus sp.]|nr:hypothetical protein [Desulfovermiculus sp.]
MKREEFEIPDYGITETWDELREQRDELREKREARIAELQDRLVQKTGIDKERLEWELSLEQARYAEELEEIDQKMLKRSAMETGQPRYTEEIEKIRDNVSEHLASKLARKDQKYRERRKDYLQDKIDYEQKYKETYFVDPPRESELGGMHMATEIELAKEGITMDDVSEVSKDYDEILESGDEYFRSKDRLEGLLSEVSFEEAEEILEKGNQEGKYTREQYQNLKAHLRRHYEE